MRETKWEKRETIRREKEDMDAQRCERRDKIGERRECS